ncbi:hypothetical protein ACHAW5_003002 [Stephanodiscus triporus]|uniref:Uncharacterized protein n=1 Tax=Stephanodiscus triporus TaxID=2934178 RepID=A0ABD3MY17_9STRA
MTAIKTAPSSPPNDEASSQDGVRSAPVPGLPPSATEEEAKTRYTSALSKGVRTLLERGQGRERASVELLNEIADGCAPDEEEIFQTMETLGISLEDATRVMTVSAAFRKAQIQGRSTIEAIDELTSRLNLANLLRGGGSPRSSSPTPSASAPVVPLTPGGAKSTEDSLHIRPSATSAKKCQRPPRITKTQQQQGRGRKRALAEKTPEKRDGNVMIEEKPNGKAAASDLEVKEKIMNAKLSKAEGGKKPKSSSTGAARAKSPEGGPGARGRRASVEESQSTKRPRTRSQTEENDTCSI